ncbi:MAG: TolC family protein, partial [Gammaproteobacteria bacterium]
ARTEASLAFYERTVLTALEETEGALLDFRHEQARRQFLQASAQASQQAADLARQRYDAGATDFLSVLTPSARCSKRKTGSRPARREQSRL